MKIYESAVRKPISTVLLFVGVMVFGLFSLSRLSVDQYPEIEIPQISVITMYPGANAADIETNITRVLEDNLNTVNNLKIFQKSCVSMFHERLTHSLHCSEFVEFTLCIAKVVLTGTFITTLRLAVYIEIITDLKLAIALIHLQ